MIFYEEREKLLDGKMGFSREDIADGKLQRFLDCMLENDCEVHIRSDGCTVVVEYLRDTTASDGIRFYPVDTYKEVVVDGKYVDWEKLEADGKK